MAPSVGVPQRAGFPSLNGGGAAAAVPPVAKTQDNFWCIFKKFKNYTITVDQGHGRTDYIQNIFHYINRP